MIISKGKVVLLGSTSIYKSKNTSLMDSTLRRQEKRGEREERMHIDFLKDVWNAVIFQLALSIREQSSGGGKTVKQSAVRHSALFKA